MKQFAAMAITALLTMSYAGAQQIATPSSTTATAAPRATPLTVTQVLDGLAAKMAAATSHSKQKSLVVFDFIGPGEQLTLLGQMLTDQFSAALAKKVPTVNMLGRAAIAKEFAMDHFDPLTAVLAPCHSMITQVLDTKSCVAGHFTIKDDALILVVRLYRYGNFKKADDAEKQEERSDPIVVTREMAEASRKILQDDEILDYPKAGENGISKPECVDCQYPAISDDGMMRRIFQGEVLMAVVVDENGATEKIRVLKPSSHDVTRSVIHAVDDWKFDPARHKDGQPVAAWIVLDVRARKLTGI